MTTTAACKIALRSILGSSVHLHDTPFDTNEESFSLAHVPIAVSYVNAEIFPLDRPLGKLFSFKRRGGAIVHGPNGNKFDVELW